MSTEPQALRNFHKLNTMRMRAFALATTNLQGTQYYIAAGFGSDDFFGDDNVNGEVDLATYLRFHLVIVPDSGFVTRLMRMYCSDARCGLDLRYPVFGDSIKLFEQTKHLKCGGGDTDVVRACVEHLRASVRSNALVLANHVAYFHDPTDVPIDMASTQFLERITAWTSEAAMNMRLLPATEVKYTLLDGGRVRLEFGRLLDSSELRYAC